jgi:hypothetical protein
MSKPCDTQKYQKFLPCVDRRTGVCVGAMCWTRTKAKSEKLSHLSSCPWIEHVRDYWAKRGYGRNPESKDRPPAREQSLL